MMKYLISIVLTFSLFCITAHEPCSAETMTEPTLRVLLVDDVSSVSVSLTRWYRIYEGGTNRLLSEGSVFKGTVKPSSDGILIGNIFLPVSSINIRVSPNSTIDIEKRRFRGAIDIVRKANDKLMVINRVSIEDYLYGVLFHEVNHLWPIEVLKAQAIAARTFAVYQAEKSKEKSYDLRNDIYSQVYGGKTSEKWTTTRAVDLTKGEILTYNGHIFPAYFHATCAGHTEDSSALWKIDLRPLQGGPCRFCLKSPHYKWTREVPLSVLEEKMRMNGYEIGLIDTVMVTSKTKFGRVEKIEIKDTTGASHELSGKLFRQILGPNEIKSTKFDIMVNGNAMILTGHGWGHGVGLCQWGAYEQARLGRSAEDILKFYYPGSKISKIGALANGAR